MSPGAAHVNGNIPNTCGKQLTPNCCPVPHPTPPLPPSVPLPAPHQMSQWAVSQWRGSGRRGRRMIPKAALVSPATPTRQGPGQKLSVTTHTPRDTWHLVHVCFCLNTLCLSFLLFSNRTHHLLFILPLCFFLRPEAERKSLLFCQRQGVL